MTVVVFAGGVMAADSLVTHNGTRIGGVQKIARGPSGAVAGAAGCAEQCARFLRQVEAGALDKFNIDSSENSLNALLVMPDGALFRIGPNGHPWPISAGFAAVGCGQDIAIGALHMGATAQQAVEAAIAWDNGCGGVVQIERLDNGAIRPAGKRRKAA